MALLRRPGISVVHSSLPERRTGLVRCDVAAMIGFIEPENWPEDAVPGDFVHIPLHRNSDLTEHPMAYVYSHLTHTATRAFFHNGGGVLHLLGLCVEDPAAENWAGSSQLKTGVLHNLIHWLRGEESVALLAAPDAASLPATWDRSGRVEAPADALYDELLAHCREMINRFLIVDPPQGLHGQPLRAWAQAFRERYATNRAFGALYYPWLYDRDQPMPPSGAMMGVFARIERSHQPFGVVWPPANVLLEGVSHAELMLDWKEAGDLAVAGINPLVVQSGRGVLVFGARTLSTDDRWTHINSRRITSMIAEQLRRDSEWAVFEHNTPGIWSVLVRDVSFRLDQLWERGVLTALPDQERYRVQCDEETNPPALREAGLLNVWVDLRPVGTTEHITIELRLGGRDVIGE